MEILNKLDQQLNQIGKTVAEKAKNIADSAGTSGIIHQEEAKIKECYTAIGKQLVQNSTPQDLPKECEDLYAMIQSLEEEIRQRSLQSQLQQTPPIPAVSACTNCGASLEPDQLFCISCGARIQPAASVHAPLNVPNISAESTSEEQDIDKTELVSMPPVEKADGNKPKQGQATPAACPACGAETTNGQVYCIQCGALLR